MSPAKFNLLIVFIMFFLVVIGCETEKAKQDRLNNVAQAAKEAGEKAGRAEGH